MTALVIRADARALPLPDASVDLVVTSPPYFGLRSYTDGGEHYAGQIGAEQTPAAYVAALLECTAEWMRVLKPSGSLWVNLGDKYSQRTATRHSSHQDGLFPGRPELVKDWRRDKAAGLTRMPQQNVIDAAGHHVPEKSLMGLPWRYALGCIGAESALADPNVVKLLLRDVALGVMTLADAEQMVDDLASYPRFGLGLILRAEVIWSKPNGLPESVTDRVRRSHEQWFHMVKEPRYYSAIDEVREAHADPRPQTVKVRATGGYSAATRHPMMHPGRDGLGFNPLGKLPGSVWEIATQPLSVPGHLAVDHFAAFPMEWPRRIIRGWSPPTGTVLDPFGGTGTTALVADMLGRTGISIDASHDYGRIAQWRTTDPRERARAMGVTPPPPVTDGQMELV